MTERNDKSLTVAELARLLGISSSAFYTRIHRYGLIDAVLMGKPRSKSAAGRMNSQRSPWRQNTALIFPKQEKKA